MLTMTRPIIIDFGKACDVSKVRLYKLSQKEKEKHRQNQSHCTRYVTCFEKTRHNDAFLEPTFFNQWVPCT